MWVAFEDVVLVFACLRGVEETRQVAEQQATAEALSESERAKAAAPLPALHRAAREPPRRPALVRALSVHGY